MESTTYEFQEVSVLSSIIIEIYWNTLWKKWLKVILETEAITGMKSSKTLNSKKQGEFDWVVFPENTNFAPNSATAMCLIISIHDDKKQTMGRYPKLKLYHYSSKRSEIVVTIPARRQACCWILRKLQTTQNSGTQPVQNPLREIYRTTFAVVTEPSEWNQNAASTFCTTIKYILTLSKSTLTHSQIFQSHSPTFLKSTLLNEQSKKGR